MDLFDIPYLADAASPLAVHAARPDLARTLLDHAAAVYGRPCLAAGDVLTRAWLRRAGPPFAGDLRAVARAANRAGVYTLNLSYEWACTAAVAADRPGAPVLLRALDWPLAGMTGCVVAARHQPPAGPYFNLTYPGFVGVLQGLAPGRFAAAVNQAPPPHSRLGTAGSWLTSRVRGARSTAMPAAFLLRLAFERASSFEAALDLLASTPVCLPAIFTLCGARPGEQAVVESAGGRTVVRRTGCVAANHWTDPDLARLGNGPRLAFSRERAAFLTDFAARPLDQAAPPLAWLRPPVLNDRTRLAFEACPASGALHVVAMDGPRRASRVLSLAA